ncbi:MAG: DUF6249 domain-containing protein [Gilvibacter sp.]
MGTEIIIVPIFFGVVFGIVYLIVSARNKERLALIEKGADASIFYSGKKRKSSTQIVVLNFALLLMGVGLGIFLGGLFTSLGMDEEIAMPGTIFFTAGAGLLTGFYLTKKFLNE